MRRCLAGAVPRQKPNRKRQARRRPPNQDALPRPERPKHDVMAVVNGEDIRRDALAAACVDRFGEEMLEGMVNKRLIEHHCRNRNITVTEQELDAEIDRMAARFKIGRQQWLQMLRERAGHQRTTIHARHPLADARAAQARRRPAAGDRPADSGSLRSAVRRGGEGAADRRRHARRGRATAPPAGGQSGRLSPAWRCRSRRTSTARASAG